MPSDQLVTGIGSLYNAQGIEAKADTPCSSLSVESANRLSCPRWL